jgi:hypothetical protein
MGSFIFDSLLHLRLFCKDKTIKRGVSAGAGVEGVNLQNVLVRYSAA